MQHHPLCRPRTLAAPSATGTLQPAWRSRALAWALFLAALLVLTLLPGWATAQTGTWSPAAGMGTVREYHSATLLPSGKVLVAGGRSNGTSLASAELYDPATNIWSSTSSMGTARLVHTATLLPGGKVLVAGGTSGNNTYLASAELYDPATNTWSSTVPMGTVRYYHTATVLPSGKVLVAGGFNLGSGSLASAELYDPGTHTWTSTAPMGTVRSGHTATLLPSGKVLVAGGNYSGPLANAELYDPDTNAWSITGPMGAARDYHTATLLPSGKVLVAGGFNSSSALASVELYDPVTNTWSSTVPMGATRFYHTATLLPSGKVLVAGGFNFSSGGYLASAELYDPGADTWSTTGLMGTARYVHTATLLPSGKVLVAAGVNVSSGPLASAELYDAGAPPTVTAITPATGPTLGGTAVTLTGTHFTGATSAAVCGVALGSLVVVNDTTLTGTTAAHAAGVCDVVVTTNFGPGTGTALFSYAKSAQTLTFGTAAALVVGGPAGTVSATSSGVNLDGSTVFTSQTPGTCTVSGSSVSPVAAGICTIAADNPGNGDFDAAPQVSQSITVDAAPIRNVTGTPAGASAITASFEGGNATCGYASTQFPTAAAVGGALPAGFGFAQGAFGFTTTQCGTGATLTLTLTFDQPLPANARLFKFNGSTWAEFTASINGNTVTYTVTDNGAGDNNTANGVITDPVAVGVPVAAISPTPVPTLGQWALVLLSLMAAALGMGTLQRRVDNRS